MVTRPWFAVSIVAVSFSIASGLPLSSDKVLHRVVRQFDPSQFLNPNFVALGGQFNQGQQFQQSGSGSSSSNSDDNSNSTSTGDVDQTQTGGSSSAGSQASGAFSIFSPAQFFLQPNQNMQTSGSLFSSSSSSSASQGASPYFSVGVAPFSNLISPSQFISPRDKVQYNTETAAGGTVVAKQSFTGNAAGGPDPSGPVGQTGDSGTGENFKPPNFFLNPGSSF